MNDDDAIFRYVGGFAFIVICIAIGVFIYMKTSTYSVAASAVDDTWQRDISVEQFKALPQDTYDYQVPPDAYSVQHYTTSHMESYLCGETCHEVCYGSGKHESCSESCITDTCWRSVTDYKARYLINRWTYDHTLTNKGHPADERVWPDFTPQPDPTLGNNRESSRVETFYVTFKTTDSKSFTYITHDLSTWRTYAQGIAVSFAVNRMEEPQWDTLKVEARE